MSSDDGRVRGALHSTGAWSLTVDVQMACVESMCAFVTSSAGA
jgi:hypothetical protein